MDKCIVCGLSEDDSAVVIQPDGICDSCHSDMERYPEDKFDLSFEAIEARAAKGQCGLCGNNVFVNERGYRRCALCGAEKLVGYKCPGCRSTSGVGDKMAGCSFCGQPLIEDAPACDCPVCHSQLASKA